MSELLTPGTTVTLVDGIRRLVAPNPGMMTGPGTNTYLVGDREIAVIDPGPEIDSHIDRILTDAGGRIRWILATHTHPDHSPAVARLARETGAAVIGLPAPDGPQQDRTFRPDRQPADGEVLTVDGRELLMLHTPGHASNHVCFLVTDCGWLITGDHIINGSTVVIDPPDGSMSAYLASLEKLKDLSLQAIAGGHGAVIESPYEAIEWLVEHRLRREAKVIDKLREHPGTTLPQLVKEVYDEIDPAIHRLAERSLLAHLIKLREDGDAIDSEGRWTPVFASDQGGA